MYPTRYSDALWRKPTGMEQARLDEGSPPPRRCRSSFRVIIPAQLVVGYNRATMTVTIFPPLGSATLNPKATVGVEQIFIQLFN